MKTFKVICATAVLVLSLSIPAHADTGPGDGHGPGKSTKVVGTMTTSDDTVLDAPETAGNDGGLLMLTDILWALASIF